MNILVTGGLGYIGSHTCVKLLESGYTPIIVDNLYNSKKSVLYRIEQITGKKPLFYYGDVVIEHFSILSLKKIILLALSILLVLKPLENLSQNL